MKKTKIVATLGPASSDLKTIKEMILSGADVFRFNFSHGTHEEHLERLNIVRQAEKETGKIMGIMLDTKGAEIRTTVQDTDNGKIEFKKGDSLRIAMDPELKGNHEKISVTYPGLFDDVQVGGKVLFDDGDIETTVIEKDHPNKELVVNVENNGVLGSQKGVNAPGVSINLPGITEKDKDDILFGIKNGISYIAASFVRKPEDVIEIKEMLKFNDATNVQIIPKIESAEGIKNMDEIIAVSDGLMVPRGDMGVEIPAQKVPLVQKDMIRKMNIAGKPVITATDMLDSMIENPRPTRAEASDVANAVFDGTDATMLSGESANGSYPVEAVDTMAAIDEEAETELVKNSKYIDKKLFDTSDTTEAIGDSVSSITRDVKDIKLVVASTSSGYTARMISKHRPNTPILAITYDEKVQRGLTLNYGVIPVISDVPENIDNMIEISKKVALENNLVKKGDLILITAGVPMDKSGTTNMLTIQTV